MKSRVLFTVCCLLFGLTHISAQVYSPDHQKLLDFVAHNIPLTMGYERAVTAQPINCGTPSVSSADLDKLQLSMEAVEGWKSEGITYVPIKVHLVRPDNGSTSWEPSPGEIARMFSNISHELYGGKMMFFTCGPVESLNSTRFHEFQQNNGVEVDALLNASNPSSGALNMYFVHTITAEDGSSFGGFAYFPENVLSSSTLFLAHDSFNDYSSSSLVPHELGHNFSLPHTFNFTEEGPTEGGAENVARSGPNSNCSVGGDRFCDTPADPRGPTSSCVYTGGAVDQFNAPYVPSTANYMSYYGFCTNSFTPEQESSMDAGRALRASFSNIDLSCLGDLVALPNDLSVTRSGNTALLSWTDIASNETGYLIERAETSSPTFFRTLDGGGVIAGSQQFNDVTLSGGVDYIYRIRALNGSPDITGFSNVVCTNPSDCQSLVPGCTNMNAHNYDPGAEVDNGTCIDCFDGVLNGDETGVDCGGVLCNECACDNPTYNALMDLFNNTNGPQWTNNGTVDSPNSTSEGWGKDCDYCSWFGVTCSSGEVTRLILNSNNLTGTIPSSIGNLTALDNLALYLNDLTGEIPSSIGQLTNLTRLSLNNNGLSASIPSSIGNLSMMTELRLQNNQLSGTIPTSISGIVNLEYLNIGSNLLTGSIPEALTELAALETLLAAFNQLTGPLPPGFSQMPNLEVVYLHYNQLSGSIPEDIGDMAGLRYFVLRNNNLTGEIPASLGQITTLINIKLNNNSLSGCFPALPGICGMNYTDDTFLPGYSFISNRNLPYRGDFQQVCNGEPQTGALCGLGGREILEDCSCGFPVTCDDGVQNGNETGTDCGGPDCQPCIIPCNETSFSYQVSVSETEICAGESVMVTFTLNATGNPPFRARIEGDNLPGGFIEDMPGDGTPVSFTVVPTSTSSYQISNVEDAAGCQSSVSQVAQVSVGEPLSLPSLSCVNTTTTSVTISYDEQTAASSHTVSVNGGAPVSANGGNFTASGLPENQDVAIEVIAFGEHGCPNTSEVITCRTDAASCTDGIRNGDEEGIDCGGSNCGPCECTHLDYVPLMEFYNSTNGSSWGRSGTTDDPLSTTEGWGRDCAPCNWFGVRCNDNDRVICIDMDGVEFDCSGSNSGGNNLTGTLPDEIGMLTELVNLHLNGNTLLSGVIPSSIGNLVNLEALTLSRCNISDPIPVEIGALSQLQILELDGNDLQSTLPDEMYQLSELRTLDLSSNLLFGELSPLIGNLVNLQRLDIRFTAMSGPIPGSIGNLTALEEVSLDHNQFSGQIPQEIGQLQALRTLALDDNNFLGAIPSTIGNLSNLTDLDISDNGLMGPIPDEIGQLLLLQFFSADKNNLSGPLPQSIRNLSTLEALILSENNLEGTIPDGLGSLPEIQFLHLDNNNFSGCFPSDFSDICALEYTEIAMGRGYDFTDNPRLPYFGDYERICDGDVQIGAPCSDNSPDTSDDSIDNNCNCLGQLPVSCSDGIQNGNETGIDCGGPDCTPCIIPCNETSFTYQVTLSDNQICAGESITVTFTLNATGNPPYRARIEGFGLPVSFIEDMPGDGTPVSFTVTPTTTQFAYQISNVEDAEGCGSTPAWIEQVMVSEPVTTPTATCETATTTSVTISYVEQSAATGHTVGVNGGTPVSVTGGNFTATGLPEDQNVTIVVTALGQLSCPDASRTITCRTDAPTCSDGIQNGNETEIDCGGPDCAPCFVPCDETEYTYSITASTTQACAGEEVVFDLFLTSTVGNPPYSLTVSGPGMPTTTFPHPGDGSSVQFIQAVTQSGDFTIDQMNDEICVRSGGAAPASIIVDQPVPAPVIICTEATQTSITINWTENPVFGAYQVSVNGENEELIDGGVYTITGLSPDQLVDFSLNAIPVNICPIANSQISCRTLADPCVGQVPTFTQPTTMELCSKFDFVDLSPLEVEILNGSNGTIEWFTNLAGTEVIADQFNFVPASAPFSVFARVLENDCASAISEIVLDVVVAQAPVFDNLPDILCAEDPPFVLPLPSDGISGSWSLENGTPVTSVNPADYSGQSLELFFDPEPEECAIFLEHIITVPDLTNSSFEIAESAICVDSATVMEYTGADAGAKEFFWSSVPAAETLPGNTATPSFTWSEPGPVVVSLTTVQDGCESEPFNQSLEVEECEECDRLIDCVPQNGQSASLVLIDTFVDVGATVCVPVLVADLTSFVDLGFSLQWDSAVFSFVEVRNLLPELGVVPVVSSPYQTDEVAINIASVTSGTMSFYWRSFAPEENCTLAPQLTLPDATTLFEVCLLAAQVPLQPETGLAFVNQPQVVTGNKANQCQIEVDAIVAGFGASVLVDGACEHLDYAGLMAFYNSTNGPDWTHQTGWLEGVDGTSCDPCNFNGGTWYGIACTGGRVTCIDMDETMDCLTTGGVSNNLSGSLPPELSSLDMLEALLLQSNQISGSLPSEWSVLANIKHIDIGFNQLNDSLPPEWSTMISLERLSLSSNQISGPLPPEWSSLNNLTDLSVGFNQLSGSLPPEWSTLDSIETLNFSNNQLGGSLPVEWSGLNTLLGLSVNNNQLEGLLPSEWSSLINASTLFFSNNDLNGSLPLEWMTLTKLKQLYLDRNQFSESLPSEWSNMVDLERLDVSGNQLTGSLPPDWSALINLEKLYLNGNQIGGSLPSEWATLTRLEELLLYVNQLTGSLPSEWSSMTVLEDLELDRNQISGELPSGWGGLTNLSTLSLHNNQLEGSLPAEWSGLSNLEILRLENNRLNGPLPAEWSSITNLRALFLQENQLSGSLPEVWSTFENMFSIRLNDNNLSGCIPESYSRFCSIGGVFNLSNNSFLPSQGNTEDFCATDGAQSAQLGASCNDGNPATTNDQIDENCNCLGEAVISCENVSAIPPFTSDSTLCRGDIIEWVIQGTGGVGPYEITYTFQGDTLTNLGGNGGLGIFDVFTMEIIQVVDANGCVSNPANLPPVSVALAPSYPGFTVGSCDFSVEGELTINIIPNNVAESYRVRVNSINNIIDTIIPATISSFTVGNIVSEEDVSYSLLSLNEFDCPGVNSNSSCTAPLNQCTDGVQNGDEEGVDCGGSNCAPCDCEHLDYAALMALYASTNGPSWMNRRGWEEAADGDPTACNPCNFNGAPWYGITCQNDRVICVDLDGDPDCSNNTETGNNLQGEIPQSFFNLSEVQCLSFAGEGLTGTLPEDYTGVANTLCFSFRATTITGQLPEGISAMANMKQLVCADCDLTGEVPSVVASLDSLEVIDLPWNNLSGEISPWIGDFPKLRLLFAPGNGFSGPLPESLGDLPVIREIFLQDNELTGGIPESLAGLDDLQMLALSRNGLTGDIPIGLFNMPALTALYLYGNELTGDIGAITAASNSITSLYLDDNLLSGCYTLNPGLCAQDQVSSFTNFAVFDGVNYPFYDTDGYNFSGNTELAFEGDYDRFCGGEDQVGSSCDDGNRFTSNDVITQDCGCEGEPNNAIRDVAINISDPSGNLGQEVTFDFVADSLANITAFQFRIDYPEESLQFVSAEGEINGREVQFNNSSPGTIQVLYTSIAGPEVEGINVLLLTTRFLVLDTCAADVSIANTAIEFNTSDDVIPANNTDVGQFNVDVECCGDGIQNGDETGVDCGGTQCEPCSCETTDLTILTVNFIRPTCSEDNGILEADVSAGGTPPYTFEWSNGDRAPRADSLAAESYSLTVTDVNGCFEIVEFNELLGENRLIPICPSDTSYTIPANLDTLTLGVPLPFTGDCPPDGLIYRITGATSAAGQGVLEALNFNIGVTNVLYTTGLDSCSFNITVEQAIDVCDQLRVELNRVNGTECGEISSGIIDLSVSGGSGNYMYDWSHGPTTPTLTELPNGVYLLEVTDAGTNCKVSTGFWLRPSTIDCDQTTDSIWVSRQRFTPSDTITVHYSVSLRPGLTLNFGNGETIPITDANGSVEVTYDRASVFYPTIFEDGELVKRTYTVGESNHWDGFVTSTQSYLEPVEDHCDIYGNSVGYIPRELSERSYYWTNFVYTWAPVPVVGDESTTIIRVRNSNELGGLSCYDTRLILRGDKGLASVAYMETGCDVYSSLGAGETHIRGATSDLATVSGSLQEWNEIKLELRDDTIRTYLNDELRYELAYEGEVGNILGINLSFKGSGEIDWIRCYDHEGYLNFEQDFELGCEPGCLEETAHNYNPNATEANGDCIDCNDGVQNGTERGIDCGGPLCVPCNECSIGINLAATNVYNICPDEEIELGIDLEENQTAEWRAEPDGIVVGRESTLTINRSGGFSFTITDTLTGCSIDSSLFVQPNLTPPVIECTPDTTVVLNLAQGDRVTVTLMPPEIISSSCGIVSNYSEESYVFGNSGGVEWDIEAGNGQITACRTQVTVISTDSMTFFIDEANIRRIGTDTMMVPIGVMNFEGGSHFSFHLTAADVGGQGELLSSLTSINASLASDLNATLIGLGKLRVEWTPNEEDEPVTLDDGTMLFEVALVIRGDFGDCVDLVFSETIAEAARAMLLEEEVFPSTIDGSVCLPTVANIEGRMLRLNYDLELIPLPDVMLDLRQESSTMLSDPSASDGSYSFADQPLGDTYTIVPTSGDDWTSGIDILDVILVRDIAYGFINESNPTTPYEYIAADVYRDCNVDIVDLVFETQILLGGVDTFPFNTSWRFVPADYEFPAINNLCDPAYPEEITIDPLSGNTPTQDFIGVKIGDLSFDVGFPPSGRSVGIGLTDQTFFAGDTIILGTRVPAQIVAAKLLWRYDERVLTPVHRAQMINGHAFKISRTEKPGVLHQVFTDLTGGDELVFVAKSTGRLSEVLHLLPGSTVGTAAGELSKAGMEWNSLREDRSFSESIEVFPNPVYDQLTIKFSSPVSNDTELLVRDMAGRLIHRMEIPEGETGGAIMIDTPSWVRGAYLISISGDVGIYRKVVIKQ